MTTPQYTKKDFVSSSEVRWCPGCGDYVVLSAVQQALTSIGKSKEDICFISGIGCSSRFPYYIDTFGVHSIHGRAPAIASGVKTHNPNLSVWVITGDGDGLSIGGNHFIHAIRRNLDFNILLFNNEIYGLTKGQYSPTTREGTVTKSSPYGSIDRPFIPASLSLGAEATFFARVMDTDPKQMTEVFLEATKHKGTSVIEILQNCVIFNNKVHDQITNRAFRDENTLQLVHGKPLIFGKDKNKGIRMKGFSPEVVTIGENGITEKDILVHDAHCMDSTYALILSRFHLPSFPVPMGIFRSVDEKNIYENRVHEQIEAVKAKKGKGSMQKLLESGETWVVK